MNVLTQALLSEIQSIEAEQMEQVKKAKHRLKFHLMPPVGWLNDPNGLCQFLGTYHVFFQYSPFDAAGGLKVWGHYTSRDLVHWVYAGTPILPDCPYDCHGAYSGSAFIDNGKMHLFYTGNVKHEGNYDYINNGREANTIYLFSEDGKQFSEKTLLMELKDFPKGYTCHIRDPKVWKQDQHYCMCQGARTKQDQGAILLYRSDDLKNWTFQNELTTTEDFGYMWECPDIFRLGNQWIVSVSPQGLKSEEYRYQNIYQSGYFLLEGDPEGAYKLGPFTEWDMGFDFYAPQTFQDEQGRRILIGWIGLPDIEKEYTNPTVMDGWQHALTVPREITNQNGVLRQYPVAELESLRGKEVEVKSGEVILLEDGVCDLEVSNIQSQKCGIYITQGPELNYNDGIFEMIFSGDTGSGRKVRKAKIKQLDHVRVLIDTSVIEVYLNHGETVFTTRYYPAKCVKLEVHCDASSNQMWLLRNDEMIDDRISQKRRTHYEII